MLGTQSCSKRRDSRVERFHHVSTDEVYGDLAPRRASSTEETRSPREPVHRLEGRRRPAVLAYSATYGLDASITRCSNNYGPYQFPEKLIPLFVTNALDDVPLPMYGDGGQVA